MHEELRRAIDALTEREQIVGYDPFGFRPEVLDWAAPPVHWLYRHYFRCDLTGAENVPEGRVLLIANHSGQLPIDAAMIAMGLLVEGEQPRVVRSMIERFVPTLPFVFTFLNRAGQLVGTPDNARRLLRRENTLLVFPEGARGISKPFTQRYELERFGTGFMRLALETNTPIVPIGVIGAEEQYISLGNLPSVARLINAPSFPLLLNLLPLPVKYRIRIGAPITVEGDPEDEDRVIRAHVRRVSNAVEELVAGGLRERDGWFT